MRLTLRTLLAYLDDTLAAEQTRVIGEKVAESELAQELIEKLRKVTRKRRLAPPTATGEDPTSDPNTIAEYLDNTLEPEHVEEVEQTALNSDALLAEVAACHQILALVLGEPMQVPPTAHQRMYRLVRGRESIPYRKPSSAPRVGVAPPDPVEVPAEADDPLLLGLPAYSRKQSLSRNLVPIFGVLVLMGALIGSILILLPKTAPMPGEPNRALLASLSGRPKAEVEVKKNESEAKKNEPNAKGTEVAELPPPMSDVIQLPADMNPEMIAKAPVEKEPQAEEVAVAPKEPLVVPVAKPDPDRKLIGSLETRDALLLSRQEGEKNWTRVVTAAPQVRSTEHLLSLPNSHAEVKLETGVRVMLWGNLPEYLDLPILESRVILYNPAQEFDADLLLQGGRVFLSNRKQPAGPAKVRVRFLKEVWDITLLDAKSEVALDLFGTYAPGTPFSKEPGGEPPQTTFSLAVLGGKVGVKHGFKDYPSLDAPRLIYWDNKGQGATEPRPIDAKELEFWKRVPPRPTPQTRELDEVYNGLVRRLNRDSKVEIEFGSTLKAENERPAEIVYAIQCLQAIDSVGYLADALMDERFDVRAAAIFALKHWMGASPERDLVFHTELVKKKGYTESDADTVMQLFHGFSRDKVDDPATVESLFDLLSHERLCIRELAYLWMSRFDPAGAKEIKFFDANAPAGAREAVVKRWKASWTKRFMDAKKK